MFSKTSVRWISYYMMQSPDIQCQTCFSFDFFTSKGKSNPCVVVLCEGIPHESSWRTSDGWFS